MEELELRMHSLLLAYKQKEDRRVRPCPAAAGESDHPPLCRSRRLRAHSTPGSIPAMDHPPTQKKVPINFGVYRDGLLIKSYKKKLV